MAGDDLSRLLRWYPRAWRERYGEELVLYMEDQFGAEKPPLGARLSLAAGGIRERARRSGLAGDSAPPPDRVRAGTLLVLVGWTAIVIAGSSFAKLSEHFDSVLPHDAGAHRSPDLAYTIVQTVAAVAGIMVMAGVALAVPAFVRYLRAGGWRSIRGHVLRAAAGTVLTAGLTVAVIVWAGHLSSHQRNGGVPAYGALFLIWAVFLGVSLALWTVVAVAAARQVTFSRFVLAAEAGLAVAVTSAMVWILAATSWWWGSMAAQAPSFLGGGGSSPLGARLAATVVLMAVATAAASLGAIRILRSWPVLRES